MSAPLSPTPVICVSHGFQTNYERGFYNGLAAAEKKAVDDGFLKAQKIHRDMTRDQDLSAKKVLTEKGMTVTELSAAEMDRFRKQSQPAVKAYLDAEVSRQAGQGRVAARAPRFPAALAQRHGHPR